MSAKMLKLLMLFSAGLLVAGCRSGGGGGSSPAFLLPSGGSGDSEIVLASESSMTTNVNPEPSSMILLGVGLAGLAAKSLKKRKKTI